MAAISSSSSGKIAQRLHGKRADSHSVLARWLIAVSIVVVVIGYALASTAARAIESNVRTVVQKHLVNHQWVRISVAGQDVRLSGRVPIHLSPPAVDELSARVRRLHCDGWLGHLRCVRTVTTDFEFGVPTKVRPMEVSHALPQRGPDADGVRSDGDTHTRRLVRNVMAFESSHKRHSHGRSYGGSQ